MGARGPAPDPSSEGHRGNRLNPPELAPAGKLTRPDPPPDLLPETITWWDSYWKSDVARAVQADTDLPALIRLAKLYDERSRAYQELREHGSGTDVGSQGQPVQHPLTKYIAQLDAEIRQLEDRFGLNPRARRSLGLDMTPKRVGLEDLGGDDEDIIEGEVVELLELHADAD